MPGPRRRRRAPARGRAGTPPRGEAIPRGSGSAGRPRKPGRAAEVSLTVHRTAAFVPFEKACDRSLRALQRLGPAVEQPAPLGRQLIGPLRRPGQLVAPLGADEPLVLERAQEASRGSPCRRVPRRRAPGCGRAARSRAAAARAEGAAGSVRRSARPARSPPSGRAGRAGGCGSAGAPRCFIAASIGQTHM